MKLTTNTKTKLHLDYFLFDIFFQLFTCNLFIVEKSI